jgi:hypothetical protein
MPNVAKLLLFPKPAPAPIETVEHTITLSFGAETYAMTIHAKIQRVPTQPRDRPSPDFERARELEFCELLPAPEGGDPNVTLTRGPSLCSPGAELSCLCPLAE